MFSVGGRFVVTSSSAPPMLMNMHISSCAVSGYRTISGYRLASTVFHLALDIRPDWVGMANGKGLNGELKKDELGCSIS